MGVQGNTHLNLGMSWEYNGKQHVAHQNPTTVIPKHTRLNFQEMHPKMVDICGSGVDDFQGCFPFTLQVLNMLVSELRF